MYVIAWNECQNMDRCSGIRVVTRAGSSLGDGAAFCVIATSHEVHGGKVIIIKKEIYHERQIGSN